MKLEYIYSEVALDEKTLNDYYQSGIEYQRVVEVWQNLKKELAEKIHFAGGNMQIRNECDIIQKQLEIINRNYPQLHKEI